MPSSSCLEGRGIQAAAALSPGPVGSRVGMEVRCAPSQYSSAATTAPAARALVRQTLLGAATMLTHSEEPAQVLRARVTSPGGTTQAAIESFQAGGFEALVDTALRAAQVRGQELSAAND